MTELNRRMFVTSALAASTMLLAGRRFVSATSTAARPKFCAFIKFLQSLSYDELSDTIAELGFDGIEATVRKDGYIPPDRAEVELPKLVEALAARNLDVTIMTTDVLGVDDPNSRQALKTAAALGIKYYRMGFYRYDLNRPIIAQLKELRPALSELASLNRELGLTAVYQNHSGADFVGATLWDLRMLLEGISPQEIGCAFDLRHATIESGLAWPILYDVIKPQIGAIYAKDFQWQGRKAEHVPLGQGRVEPSFYADLSRSDYDGPISVHVEYLKEGQTKENIAALRRDFQTLKKWMAA